MQWFYARDNRQQGPVEDDEIRRMAADGRLRPDDLVWNPSLGNAWQPAASVSGLFGAPPPAAPTDAACGAPPPAAIPVATLAAPRGTGGTTPNADLTARARASLRGRWGLAIGAVLIYYLVVMGISMVGQVIPFVGAMLGSLIIGGPLALGLCAFTLAFARGQEVEIGQLFHGFRHWAAALGAYAWMMLFIVLWALTSLLPFVILGALYAAGNPSLRQFFGGEDGPRALLSVWPLAVMFALGGLSYIVTLTIVSLRYAFTMYALWDDPAGGPRAALRRSIELTRGRKGKLFLFYLRFFGWSLLALLTCGIGYLWLLPYLLISMAHFYDDLKS